MTRLRPALLDELLSDYETPEDLLGEEGLFKQLKKALLERALGAELGDHLGYEKGDSTGRGTGNSRNGHSGKTVLTEDGTVELAVPCDRNGTFEPAIVPKCERRLDGFDDRILSLYARGMTVREIRGHLQELYGVEVSPDLISRVTDAVLEEVRDWQNRPLDAVYPVVFFDALRVKIRDEGLVRNKAVYLALAITRQGEKEVLGLWIEQTEGAKFWLKVMNELKTRGVGDILIAVVDGLTGFPDAIAAVFPQTAVQTCIVHLIRNSLAFVSWKDRKKVMPDLRAIYRAETAEGGAGQAGCFRGRLGRALSGDRAGLAARLGACGAYVRLPAGDPEDDLYDECLGESAPVAAQDHQDAGQLPQRRGGGQALVSGDPQRRYALEAPRCQDRRDGAVCDPVRRSLSR